jgi:hypothetical protein
MSKRSLTAAVIIAGAALIVINGAKAQGVQYPDWGGQWERFVVRGIPGQPSHDQTKPWGFGQQAPLTPEYRKILEDSMADPGLHRRTRLARQYRADLCGVLDRALDRRGRRRRLRRA